MCTHTHAAAAEVRTNRLRDRGIELSIAVLSDATNFDHKAVAPSSCAPLAWWWSGHFKGTGQWGMEEDNEPANSNKTGNGLATAILLTPATVRAGATSEASKQPRWGQSQKTAEISTEELRRILADGSAHGL